MVRQKTKMEAKAEPYRDYSLRTLDRAAAGLADAVRVVKQRGHTKSRIALYTFEDEVDAEQWWPAGGREELISPTVAAIPPGCRVCTLGGVILGIDGPGRTVDEIGNSPEYNAACVALRRAAGIESYKYVPVALGQDWNQDADAAKVIALYRKARREITAVARWRRAKWAKSRRGSDGFGGRSK